MKKLDKKNADYLIKTVDCIHGELRIQNGRLYAILCELNDIRENLGEKTNKQKR